MEPVIYAGIGVLILLIIAGGAFLLAPSRRLKFFNVLASLFCCEESTA